MVATNIEVPPASALTGLDFVVDYTPDSATVATSALRGTKIDLTASTPVAIAGTTQQEIVQQVDPELDLRIASDITAPSGWTIYYSTDGNSWTANAPTTLAGWEALRYVKANGPLVSEGADASGRQISSSTATGLQPDNGQFSTANDSSGDGWDVFFDDMKHVYNIWHHRTGTGIDCHLRTGARCGGTWPYLLKSATNYNPNTAGTFEMAGSYNPTGWYDSVDKEIWIPTVYTRGISGVANSSVGFACISVADIAATNKWCGGSVTNGGFVSPGAGADFLTSQKCAEALYDCYQGLAESGGRIFTWNVKTGDLACVDIRLNGGAGGPCASGGLIDFGASLPDANTGGYFFASLGTWEGRIYGNVNDSNSAGYAVCIEASTGAACTGWTNPRASLGGQGRYTTLPGLAAGDPMRAACFLGIGIGLATRANCYNAGGTDISGSLTSEFLIGYDATQGMGAYSNYNPAHGTRMYWGSGSANSGKINCWDFALNGWCANWSAAGITDTNYQISLDPLKPTCIWSNADDTIIQTYNATTGTAGNCAMPAPTVNFDGGMQLPRMACSSQNAIQAWRTFTLITAVTYASARFTVKNSSGTAIQAWTNVTVPGNKIIDLASLSVSDTGQNPTFSVTFTDRTDEGDVSAKISAIGGSPELCLRPTVACPYPIVHPSQLLANSVTVTASGSTTANSVVSQFDSVARTVNIANTPTSSCATSLSGNLSTGAGVAVAGVLVTLTDTSGAILTFPADYPEASLRGQAVTSVSDSSGNYSFPLVAAGDYKLKFVDASGSILVNQAIVTASGSGMTTDYTAATSLLSPSITLVTGTPGVVDAKYNSSQSLSKVFWPTTVNAGQVSTLTFTISNISMQSKSGIGWVDSLPAGLVVDDNPNKRTTCAGGSSETLNPTEMTAVAGATSITVTNASINANVASCKYSVNVRATTAGDYRNGPSNVATTNIDKNTDATVEALAPSTAGATLCDNNVFYLQSGQLYRHPYNSLSRYAVGPTYTSGAVDAIGYNSVDGFIYGIARSTTTSNGVALTAGHLVRYSSNGILTDLGSLTGSGITDTVMATAVGGDFDNSGNLVVKATGSKTTLYSIDVSTLVATTITTTVAIEGDDLAFSKGHFYSSFGLYMYKVGVSAGTTWTATRSTIFPTNISGHRATYSDGSGRVVFVEGNEKAYAVADPSTATASSNFSLIYTYVTNPLDGAMCHAAPVPTANPDTSSAGKNVVQTKDLLANDEVATNSSGVTLVASSVKLCDPNSNPVEVSPNCTKGSGSTISVTNVGTYAVDASGVVTFTPVLDYLGIPPALNYQVSDSAGNIATSTYTPTVLDTLPTANNDTSSGPYNTDQVINIVGNDTAGSLYPLNKASIKLCAVGTADNACLAAVLDVPNEGIYSSNPDGTVTFDPYPSFKGTATPIKYTILDTSGQLTSATITPSVTAPAVPVAGPETKSVIPGGTVTFTTVTGTGGLATAVAGFNTSATCLITPASNPATCDADGVVDISGQGIYTLNAATGVVTYVADVAATAGTKTAITYQVTDVTGQTATSTLTPIVPPPPTADNETSSGAYNTAQVIDVLTGDTAGSGATLVATSVKLCATTSTAKASCDRTTLEVAGEGTYTVNPNGTVTFVPLSSFTGLASLVKYVVADSTTQLAEATIRPTVLMPALPTATPNSQAVIPGGTVSFTTITGASGLASSVVGLNASLTCLITPGSNPDSCDADGVVTVSGVGTYTLNTTTGVVTLVADPAATQGQKTALKYQVTDTFGQTATSTLTPVVPAPPDAVDDVSSGPYNTSQVIEVLTNDLVTSPATLTPSSVKLCATTGTANASCDRTTLEVAGEGTYTVNPNGKVTFVPLSTFKGQAAPVKYVVTDSTGQVTDALITVTVNNPGAPVAGPETKSVIPGGTVTFTTVTGTGGLATAVAGFNTSATCLITPASNPATCDADGVVDISGQGIYTLNAATGVVTYVADVAATAGTKTAITYQVTDVTGQTATSTLTPIVPPPPTADNETSSGAYNTAQVIDVLTGDTAGSGATLVATSVKLCATTSTAKASCDRTTLEVAGEGTYTVNPNGTVTFVPLSSFTGLASLVKYVVADSTTQLAEATIRPTVLMPALPTATPNSQAVIPGGTVSFTTITGASGLASSVVGLNASLTCLITPGSNPDSCDADGVVTVSGVGTYTLNTTTGVVTLVADPAATQGQKTALKYQVTDTFGQTATSTLTPVVPAPPDAVDDVSSGPYNTSQVIEVLTNDLVTSPATLTPSSVKLCATTGTANASCDRTTLEVAGEGTYTVNPNGKVTFVPLSTFKGQAAPVKYVVTDSTGQVTDALITVTVNNPGAPVAVNDANIGPYDTVQAITILSNDTAGDAVLPLLSSTIKLCPVAATAPFTTTNCSLVPTQAAPLVTADGSYWVDTATGRVSFDPLPTFTGQVTQPVRYIALDAFNQIATATITPEVTPPLLPTASPESRIVVPGSSVSFTTITGASGLAAGAVLQTSGSTATCLYTPNTTSCELDNEVVIVGEGTFRLVPATGIVTFTAASNAPAGNRTAITYRVTDILGNSATSTLTPIVPPPATMSPDQSTNNWDTNQTLTPLSNDIATSGTSFVTSSLKLCAVGESSATGSCSLSTLTVANEGIYRVEANGSVVFDPFPTFTGTATTINYQVTDSYGRTAGSTITVIVTPPALPVATAQTKVVGPGLSVAFTNVIGSSALATGAALQTGSVNGPCLIDPANNSCVASLTIAGEGTWTIDRNSGVATFASLNTITPGTKTPVTYRVTDVLGNSTTSTLTPVVPEPPVVANDEKIDAWDTNQIFSPFANDKFASVAPVVMSSLKLCGSGESLGSCTRTVLSIENEGTYTVNSDGTVTFDPLPSFFGAATPVTYEAVDIAGQRLHATITPVVIAPPLPAATTDEVLGKKGRSVVFSPWLNDFAGTAPDNFIGNIKLVPSSIRLCGLGQLAPNCTLTKLTTADGKYSVDTKTGKVTFVPRTGFTGMVTQPVWYQIANDWKGASGVGISTAQLITTIEAGALPTTGLDFSAVLLLGGLTCGAGVGLWQIGKGRRRGDYELPRWLDEVDGE